MENGRFETWEREAREALAAKAEREATLKAALGNAETRRATLHAEAARFLLRCSAAGALLREEDAEREITRLFQTDARYHAMVRAMAALMDEYVRAERDACVDLAENCELDNYGAISRAIADAIAARAE